MLIFSFFSEEEDNNVLENEIILFGGAGVAVLVTFIVCCYCCCHCYKRYYSSEAFKSTVKDYRKATLSELCACKSLKYTNLEIVETYLRFRYYTSEL